MKEEPISNEYNWWGIGLIIAGMIAFVFPTVLDTTVGISALLLGVVVLIFRKIWTLLVIGAFILSLGILNIIITLIDFSQSGFIVLGIVQILIGISVLKQYSKKLVGNNFGIASLILGILSILISLFSALAGIVMGILGIIFSVKQRRRSPNGIATAGLITSIIGLAISVISLIILFLLLI